MELLEMACRTWKRLADVPSMDSGVTLDGLSFEPTCECVARGIGFDPSLGPLLVGILPLRIGTPHLGMESRE